MEQMKGVEGVEGMQARKEKESRKGDLLLSSDLFQQEIRKIFKSMRRRRCTTDLHLHKFGHQWEGEEKNVKGG